MQYVLLQGIFGAGDRGHMGAFKVAKAPQSGKLWRAVESFLSMRNEECRYRWNRPGPNLCNEWLQAFAGKMECGCVRAKSAIEEAMRPSTGFKR